MDSALRTCLRKSSRAASSSAESLLNAEARRLKRENRAEPCFFRALGTQVNSVTKGYGHQSTNAVKIKVKLGEPK